MSESQSYLDAKAALDEATKSAWEAYELALVDSRVAFKKAMALADKAYDEAVSPAQEARKVVQYTTPRSPSWEYKEAIAVAEESCKEATAIASEARNTAFTAASKARKAADQAAWEAYHKACADARAAFKAPDSA